MTVTERPPGTLGPSGSDLWRGILARFELDAAELVLLELACQATDDAASARAVLAEAGVVAVDRYGAARAHPAVAIARQAEASASRLLGQLGLIDRSAPAGTRHASTPGPKPARRTR